MKRICVFLLLVIVLTAGAVAEPAVPPMYMYDDSKLAEEKSRLERAVTGIWKELEKHLTPQEKARVPNVRLVFSLREAAGTPVYFSSDWEPRQVFMPILSLLFFEDLCTAYAWLWANNDSLDTIDTYVRMLKYRKEGEFPNHRYPPPLKALRIPDRALSNPQVDVLSLRFRNTAFAFILAHELGHIWHRHPDITKVTPQKARSNEEAADTFALEMMRRTETLPMGAVLFFQATAYYFKNRGDFTSDKEWEAHLKTKKANHPVTAHRLRVVAKQLNADPDAFVFHKEGKEVRAGDRERVRFIAQRIDAIADILGDVELQRFIAEKVTKIDLSSWPPPRYQPSP